MISQLFSIMYSRPIADYYVLPMVKVGVHSFAKNNLQSTFISTDLEKIVAEVNHFDLYDDANEFNEHFVGKYIGPKDRKFILYWIPSFFRDDVVKFKEGRYSEFSDKLKNYIHAFSKLAFRKMMPNYRDYYTDPRLLALDKDEWLKRELEITLDVNLDGMELISKPKKNVFLSTKKFVKIL